MDFLVCKFYLQSVRVKDNYLIAKPLSWETQRVNPIQLKKEKKKKKSPTEKNILFPLVYISTSVY